MEFIRMAWENVHMVRLEKEKVEDDLITKHPSAREISQKMEISALVRESDPRHDSQHTTSQPLGLGKEVQVPNRTDPKGRCCRAEV